MGHGPSDETRLAVRSDAAAEELGRAMEAASVRLDFEEAARVRDLMQSIRSLHDLRVMFDDDQ